MKTILAILVILGAFFGSYRYIDTRYALCADVTQTQRAIQKLEERLDQKILYDKLQAIQERIWKIEDRSGKEPKDELIKHELRKLHEEKKQIEKNLDAMKVIQMK